MQVSINYEKKDGSVKHVSFYPSFLRNKDLRDEIGAKFFSNNENVDILKARFLEYSIENNIDKSETNKIIEEVFEKDGENYPYLNPLVTSIYSMEYDQFFMNIFYNAIKRYFNSDAVSLGLFLAFNPISDFGFAVNKKELPEWIDLLKKYQYIKLCPAMNYYLYQNKNPTPLKTLFDDYQSNQIKGNIIIRSELCNWTYKEDIISELHEDLDDLGSEDTDEIESIKSEIEDTEKLSEFELMEMKIISEHKTLYKSLNEILSLEIFENELFNGLR